MIRIGTQKASIKRQQVRGVTALLCATFLAGCTATTIDTQNLQPVGGLSSNFAITDEAVVPEPTARPAEAVVSVDSEPPAAPVEVAALETEPVVGAETVAVAAESPTAGVPGTQVLSDTDNTDTATQRILQASNAPAGTGAVGETAVAAAPIAPPQVVAQAAPSTAAIVEEPSLPVTAAAVAEEPKRTGIFRALFNRERIDPPAKVELASVARSSSSNVEAAQPERRVISTVSARSSALPGVDRDRVLGIPRADDSTSDRDFAPVQVASAAGLARLTPNGLKTQHSGVDVQCLKPALVRVLKQVENKFGRPVVVTSGYRSPARNQAARGAKNSLHMYCAAADIQVSGVGKWELASYLRSMSGRGGVGTYCHTQSVHIDIGPKRDWNARCRRR